MSRRRTGKAHVQQPVPDEAAQAVVAADPQGAAAMLAAWAMDPAGWCETWIGDQPLPPGVAGRGSLWHRQVEIAEALVDYREVDVVTGNAVGKDFLLGRLACWWLCTRPDSVVLTTASKEPQVVRVLWGEIRQAYRRARAPLGGHLAPEAPEWRLGPQHYALGMVARDPTALQGFRGPGGVLVIVDEAAGVSEANQQALESCASSEGSRIIRIGNPTCGPEHYFAKSCGRPTVPGRHVTIRIPSTESPNVVAGREVIPGLASQAMVQGWLDKYGEHSAVYRARVLAQFPTASSDGLIGYDVLDAARARAQAGHKARPQDVVRLGCDVGRFGDDPTVCWATRGPVAWRVFRCHKEDGKQVAHRLAEAAVSLGAVSVATVGGCLGAAPVDSLNDLIERGEAPSTLEVYPNDFGAKATDPAEWADRRTELWWLLRDYLRDTGAVDPDEGLEEELLAPTYRWVGRAKRLEPKEAIKRRIGRSTDEADALALAASGHVGHVSAGVRLTFW